MIQSKYYYFGIVTIQGSPCVEHAVLRDGKPFKTFRLKTSKSIADDMESKLKRGDFIHMTFEDSKVTWYEKAS